MSPISAIPARLILCERTGRWAAALRRELLDVDIRVWETRTLDDCWTELKESPASFLVLELGPDLDGLTRRMMQLPRRFPSAHWAAVTDCTPPDLEWWMREAGAVHVVASTRRVGPLAQMACRHLAQIPLPQQELTERIWSNLPWKPVDAASRRIV